MEKTTPLWCIIFVFCCFTAQVIPSAANDDFRKIERNNPPQETAVKPRWRALVIGINEYRSDAIKDLTTPVADARAVAETLRNRYNFTVRTLLDKQATWRRIDEELRALVRNTGPQDSVLIYYGGHGDLDKTSNEGWWFPHDAVPGNRQTYLKNADLRQKMKQIPARHVLLVSDSCFAGALFGDYRSAIFEPDDRFHRRLYASRSRLGLTSGGKEPVLDKGGDGHSIFAYHFLKYLKNPAQAVFSAGELYNEIAPIITNNSPQKPVFLPVLYTGHEGGEFIFVSKGQDLDSFASKVKLPAVQRDAKTMVIVVSCGATLLLFGSCLVVFVRPRLQQRKRETVLRHGCEQRNFKEITAQLANYSGVDEELVERCNDLVSKVPGLVLTSQNISVYIGSGMRQGIGRGPRWVLSIPDPHISRKPHCWLSFSEDKLVVTADGGVIEANGEESRLLTLTPGDSFALGPKTELKVVRFIPDRLAVLTVTSGPQKGNILILLGGETKLIDLIPKAVCQGSLFWKNDRPYLTYQEDESHIFPYCEVLSPVLLKDCDLLRLDSRDWQVSLKRDVNLF